MRHFSLNPPVAVIAFTTLALASALPAAVPDGQIEASFMNTYNFKHFLKDDNIRVNSSNGAVTLTGTVSEEYHKFLTQETVAGLPGVKSVANQLSVTAVPLSTHSDILITMKVKTALLFHKFVNASATEVHTQDGVVILSGNADSETKKRLTGEYAMDVDGVREVHNNMVVAPGYKTLGNGRRRIHIGPDQDDPPLPEIHPRPRHPGGNQRWGRDLARGSRQCGGEEPGERHRPGHRGRDPGEQQNDLAPTLRRTPCCGPSQAS